MDIDDRFVELIQAIDDLRRVIEEIRDRLN